MFSPFSLIIIWQYLTFNLFSEHSISCWFVKVSHGWACNKLKQLPWKVVSASNLSQNILNSDLSLILWYMALNLDSNLRKIALIWRRLLTSSTFINCWNIIFISFQSTSKREQTSSATVAPSEEPPEEPNRCWLLESKPLAGMAFFPKTNTCWEQPE